MRLRGGQGSAKLEGRLLTCSVFACQALLGQYIEASLLDAVHVNGKPHTSANLGFRVKGGMEVLPLAACI